MRCRFLAIVVAAVLPFVADAAPQVLPVELGKPRDDFETARFTGPSDNFLQEYLRRSAESQFENATLVSLSPRFYGIEPFRASSLDLALEGVGAAGTLGLFAGAVAHTSGLWDESTTWYIAGAAAALGAFLGYRRAQDESERARFRWQFESPR